MPWAAAAALAVVAAVMAGFMLARPATSAAAGARPVVRMSVDDASWPANGAAGTVPTAIAYYADGTHGDASAALSGPWTPDRPITMLVLVAKLTCTIQADAAVDTEGAGVNRNAVCVWRAPV